MLQRWFRDRLIIGLVIILASCGSKEESKEKPFAEPFLDEDMAPMLKQDLVCEREVRQIEEAVTSVDIMLFLDGKLQKMPVDITSYFRQDGTLGHERYIVRDIYYGGHSSKVNQLIYDEKLSLYRPIKDGKEKLVAKAKRLDICPSSDRYERYTYEGAALAVLRSIDQSFNTFINVFPELDLPGLKLKIAPVEEMTLQLLKGPRDKTQILRYNVDNAFYSPGQSEVTFLPQGQLRKSQGRKPLWEVPMVAAHEFGHHIFHHIVMKNATANDKSILESHDHCFLDKQQYEQAMEKSLFVRDRDNSYKFSLRSINEGFADLVAFYAFKKSESSLEGLECFEKTREVEVLQTNNGQNKVFDENARGVMDSAKVIKRARSSCEDIDYQGVHSVGSVVAYQVNQLFDKVSSDKIKKAHFLIQWAKELKVHTETIKKVPPSQGIFLALELAYATALKLENESLEGRCESLRKAFPSSESDYFCTVLK